MPSMLSMRLRTHAVLVCGVLMFTCGSSALADPKPLTKEEQAKVDAALDKGVAFLKMEQKKDGSWPRYWPSLYPIAQIAMPA